MKIWICGSVSCRGEEANIVDLVKTFDYFDGAIFTVNYDKIQDCDVRNPTYYMLDRHKKAGKIFLSPWIKRHDISMNIFLKAGIIRPGDWFLYIDAAELPKTEFLNKMRKTVDGCIEQKITAIHWNRPYLLRYHHDLHFVGNPHCWPQPLLGNQINIADEKVVRYDDGGCHFGDFIYNKKKRENSLLLSGVKYSLYDPPNNQFQMHYSPQGEEIYGKHELARREFCSLLEYKGYDRTLEGLEQFFRENPPEKNEDLLTILDLEFMWRDFYRYKILGHSIDDIMKDRYTFSLRKFLK